MKVIPMNDIGELDLNAFSDLLSDKTKIVFVNHVSNALGTVNNIQEIIEKSHQVGAAVLIDGAQKKIGKKFKVLIDRKRGNYYVGK